MDFISSAKPTATCHIVAMPYPGRGHINPMMNLCKQLVSKDKNIFITFVVTEEWLGLIGSDPRPDRIGLSSIPNVIPSELDRAKDMGGFFEAVWTNLEAPFELLVDHLELPVSLIMADSILYWAVGVGNRRNIPVASFWPFSAKVFMECQKVLNAIVPADHIGGEYQRELPKCTVDLPPAELRGISQEALSLALKLQWMNKAQYLLFPTIYELEPQAIKAAKQQISSPIYTICPLMPFSNYGDHSTEINNDSDTDINILRWLDSQTFSSVLFISFGSFLSVSSCQLEGIAAGLRGSGIRFLWVARGETKRLNELCADKGLIVPWCDQLRVLCHPSIGGFWTHCGWNSVKEGIFAGVPFLTFPIVADQFTNSKLIVEEWKIGRRAKEELKESLVPREESLVPREKITDFVQQFMDMESNDRKEMKARVKKLQKMCQLAISRDGSSQSSLNSFIRDIYKSQNELK